MAEPLDGPLPLVEELANALQAAVLLTALLERQLSGGEWTEPFTELNGAVRRAASAAHKLRHWAQER